MFRPTRDSLLTSLALAAAVAAGAAWLAWLAARDPEIPWLARRPAAEWILYPAGPSASAHPAVALDGFFHRAFTLPRIPRAARLEVRCFRRCRVAVNGTLVPLAAAAVTGSTASWKEPLAGDPAPLLRAGTNEILVRVANESGPPALWLSLAADGHNLATGGSWQASLAGATPGPARLATTPMDRWSSPGASPPGSNPRPAAAALALLPLLVAFAALSGAVLWGAATLFARVSVPSSSAAAAEPALLKRAWCAALLAAAALLMAALFWHDRGLDGRWGFDADGHFDYVRVILERGRLPLADEGWEMYQPPLYYLMAAGLLRLAGHARLDLAAVPWLRALGWSAFVLQTAGLLGSLRLLFPAAPRRLLAGLCLGIFLPAQIYLLQYVTNEGWAAALASAAVYLCLRCLRLLAAEAMAPPRLPFLLLGGVLGLAMLAKFSALVTVAAVAGILAGRLAALRVYAPRAWMRSLGCLALAGLLVCGWHYARVLARFHHLLVGNWDRAGGFAWWQEPGYRTVCDFLRFGQSLRAPLLSAFHSVPDALYSTLWGDGLLGGSGLLAARPPWNYGLMAAGYLLALLPTAAILTGLGAALLRVLRRPRAEELLLLGLLGGTVLAVLAMSLRIASYAQPKAFYCLPALVPLCALGGWGLDLLAGGARRLRSVLVYLLLGVWACTAYATYWMLHTDPGPRGAAVAALDPAGQIARARAALRAGRNDDAIAWLRRATAAFPDHSFAWGLLGDALERQGDAAAAVAALREALRVDPHSATAHLHLGRLLERSGRSAEALYHLRLGARLQGPGG
ncbi:MAG TPA: tetratricopeptide repeat protein [Thermoanaerobaculia bacterium]|nr:tetratricopeptide repeat protein [Thermoanaerobaculia bacterium]